MRIAVYLRASTLRQAQAQSCEQQLDRLQMHLQAQGWRLPPENILLGLAKHLKDQGLGSPSGKSYWSTATLRGILTNPTYTGQVYAGRMQYHRPRMRRSATHPIGRPHGTVHWQPPEQWIAVAAIPAVISQEQFELAQAKLRQHQSFAQRNSKAEYLLRALVSCGRCLLACQARPTGANHYYLCMGKGKEARQRHGRTWRSRFIPAQQLDDLVWQDLCALLADPEQITQALARAQGGHWLPQELQSRRENLRKARVSLEHQLERLTEAYLSSIIGLPEYQRRRSELEQRQQMIEQQAGQLQAQAEQRVQLCGLSESLEAFCRRVKAGLAESSFEQKRQLVKLLIDRVVVTDDQVEIRYVIPTSPKSEQIRFYQLRSDYFHYPSSRQHHKPLRLFRAADHLKHPAALLLHPTDNPGVCPIGPDQFQAAPAVVEAAFDPLKQLLQDQLAALAIRNASTVDDHQQQQAQCVYNDMSFATNDLLMHINAARLAAFTGFDTLAIADGGRRLRLATFTDPHGAHQFGVDFLPSAIAAPGSVVTINRLPRRQVVGQQAPSTTTANNIEEGIEDLAQRPLARSSALALRHRQQWLNDFRENQSGRLFSVVFPYNQLTRFFSKHSLKPTLAGICGSSSHGALCGQCALVASGVKYGERRRDP